MKWNMGSADRAIRFGLASIIAVSYYANLISGVLATVLLLMMGVLLVTSFVGSCPLYYPFGISTRKNRSSDTRFSKDET